MRISIYRKTKLNNKRSDIFGILNYNLYHLDLLFSYDKDLKYSNYRVKSDLSLNNFYKYLLLQKITSVIIDSTK